MICVVQRVIHASVTVGSEIVGEIAGGMVVLAAVQRDDTGDDIKWTAEKLVGLRIFRRGAKHFDLDVREVGGGILLVSNFTVAASTRHGRRPSLDGAANPETGNELFAQLVEEVRGKKIPVATGRFGADMRVDITNDGPATFLVNSRE